jgi:hypothetical protein
MLRAICFMLLKGNMHYLDQDKVLKCYLDPNETTTILTELHKGMGGSHLSTKITINFFLDVHY